MAKKNTPRTANLEHISFQPYKQDLAFFRALCKDFNAHLGLNGQAHYRDGFRHLIELAKIGQEAKKQAKPNRSEKGDPAIGVELQPADIAAHLAHSV